MILAFNPLLKQPILDGTKIHTVREDKPRRWRDGMAIQMATGVRTPAYDCFRERKCTRVVDMAMEWTDEHGLQVIIGGHRLLFRERMEFAVKDGFMDLASFESWFVPIVKKKGGHYTCRLIHWTGHRYPWEPKPKKKKPNASTAGDTAESTH